MKIFAFIRIIELGFCEYSVYVKQPSSREEWTADDLHLQAPLLAALAGRMHLAVQVVAADEEGAEVAVAEVLVAAVEARLRLTSRSRK